VLNKSFESLLESGDLQLERYVTILDMCV